MLQLSNDGSLERPHFEARGFEFDVCAQAFVSRCQKVVDRINAETSHYPTTTTATTIQNKIIHRYIQNQVMIHIDAFKAMHTYTIIQNKMIHTRYNDSNCFIQTYTTILAKRYDLHTSIIPTQMHVQANYTNRSIQRSKWSDVDQKRCYNNTSSQLQ